MTDDHGNGRGTENERVEPHRHAASSPETRPHAAGVSTEAEGGTTPMPGQQLVTADLLVEDVSIDGMCGVY